MDTSTTRLYTRRRGAPGERVAQPPSAVPRLRASAFAASVVLALSLATTTACLDARGAAATAHAPALDSAATRAFLDRAAASATGGEPTLHWSASGTAFWSDTTGRLYRGAAAADAHTGKEGHTGNNGNDAFTVRQLAPEPIGKDWSLIGLVEEDGRARIDDHEWPCAALPAGSVYLVLANALERRFLDAASGDRVAQCEQPEIAAPSDVRDSFPINGWIFSERPSPDGRWFASLDGDNFVLRSRHTSAEPLFDEAGTPRERWYFASDIWEDSGDSWSPDSRYVVARVHDTRALPGIAWLDYLSDPAERVNTFTYWGRAGEPLPTDTFSVFDVVEQKRIDAHLPDFGGESFDFFVAWSPDSRLFAVMRYARDLSRQTLVLVDATTGAARTVLEERREAGWVKWPSGAQGVVFFPDADGFLWRSDRSGFFHWYAYDLDGRLRGQRTQGDFDAGSIIGFEPAGDWIYFHAQSDTEHPYDEHLNRVRRDGSGQQQLTDRRGQHRGDLSVDGRWLVDVHEHLD